MPGISYIIHLKAPYSIIDYTQEAGHTRRGGEYVVAIVVIEDKDWPEEDIIKDSCLEVK